MRVLLASSVLQCVMALNISRTLGDHAVLQRDSVSTVWGFDEPGSQITTNFSGLVLVNITDAEGVWRQQLPPTPAGGPYWLTFSSSLGGTASLADILFGDVYLAGGQSNMQFTLTSAFNGTAEIAAANYPKIRLMTVGQGTFKAPAPLQDLATVYQNWTAATPASVGGAAFTAFSAIGYLFGRDIYESLGGNIPIGIISNNWGGTCLQSWSPPYVNAACNSTYSSSGMSNLYNTMIAPYLVGPMALTGFLWSQGECNADENDTHYYGCAFPQFIDAWRSEFGAPTAFFGFELLPAYVNDSGRFSPASLPYEREAQLLGLTAKGSGVAVANAMDLGDAQAPYGSVHPRNKTAVAARLASAALALVYGQAVPYLNPSYKGAFAQTVGTTLTVTVAFDAPSTANGLVIIPSHCPTEVGVPASECSWYEVQTVDGIWHNATAEVTVDGKGLLLTVDLQETPGLAANATRGNFSPWPVVTVFSSGAGALLPALPWNAPVDGTPA